MPYDDFDEQQLHVPVAEMLQRIDARYTAEDGASDDRLIALRRLATRLHRAALHDVAWSIEVELCSTLRRYALVHPERYEPDLARLLNEQGLIILDRLAGPDALAHAEEAVAICRRLAQGDAFAYDAELALSLLQLQHVLYVVHGVLRAEPIAVEALRLYQQLAMVNPLFRRSVADVHEIVESYGKLIVDDKFTKLMATFALPTITETSRGGKPSDYPET